MTDFLRHEGGHAVRALGGEPVGAVLDQAPFPTDGWLAEGPNMQGLALALRHARGQFVALELGARLALDHAVRDSQKAGLDPIFIAGWRLTSPASCPCAAI